MANTAPDRTLAEHFDQIQGAHERIAPYIVHTPVHQSQALNEQLGAEVYLKCEHLQTTGAFKYRGATHALLQLSEAQRAAGVYTVSSGNHGAALAAIGAKLGVSVKIGVSHSASPVKLANMQKYQPQIEMIDPGMAAREAFVAAQAQGHFVPPYNHLDIVYGQGTAALELCSEITNLDIVVAPLGGGGLLSGTALVAKSFGLPVIGVEPELAADGVASLEQGHIVPAFPPTSICDGLLTSLGSVTFPLLQRYVDGVVTVTDAEASTAQALLEQTTTMQVEPSASVTLAAVKRYPELFKGLNVGVILSGGNIARPAS